MALVEALLEIANDMEKEANDPFLKDNIAGQIIRSYSKLIKIAVKSAENTQLQPIQSVPNWEKEAHEEFRKKNKQRLERANLEEDFVGHQVEIVDGPLGGENGVPNYWNLPVGGKVGSKAVLDSSYVYRLGEDDKLHFLEDETKLLLASKKCIQESSIILGVN